MSDYIGTEEPARRDEQAIDQPAPIIPIGPGAAGVVAIPVTRSTGDPDGGSLDGEPLGWPEDHDEVEPEGEHHGLGERIRGWFHKE